ncbi:MAG: 50S ribosomal protein L22 [Flavobacteriales bacterium]|jgi:large subunit ribosomal protein L22|nr:50S ribosomal protein L22 [Flavobacteriales bacterium]NCG30610.1 50S ribosomal protein L22 [Bacteroidota bacterium]MBT3963953.1 50S ribosomal protein L22 [Flavobacteriales bacterium]MBT4704888.1 50S ribosomal protein L22 [Flavobacteriales bacterium]MBT4929663.1 50S ribosomal protein L22 [Flavobacteriales bacterium]
MGSRKHKMAQRIKEERKSQYMASLNNCPTSPRKMRLIADLVRGMDVTKASGVLQFTKNHAARDLEKLLRSAIANYEQKSGQRWEEASLFIKEISVDSGRMLKRIQPAPQGRAFRIRKRSNHVTMILGSATSVVAAKTETTETEA